MHKQVFIDRVYDIDVADPTFYEEYTRYLKKEVRNMRT